MTKAAFSLRGAMILCIGAGALMPVSAGAQSTPAPWDSGKWQFAATLYGYFPDIGGKLSFPVSTGGSSINVNANTLIDSLKFAFMGAFDAHNGKWGVFTDVLYLDVSGSKSQIRDFSLGQGNLPASTTADFNLGLKGTVWTLAGEYRVASDPAWTTDVLVGARMLGVKPKLDWSFNGDLGQTPVVDRSGSKEISDTLWDGIVGVKGRYAFGEDRRWGVPFYADVGTGQTQLTWQAAIGLSYSYQWATSSGCGGISTGMTTREARTSRSISTAR